MLGWGKDRNERPVIGACLLADDQLWLAEGPEGAALDGKDPTAWQQLRQRAGRVRMQVVLSEPCYQLLSVDKPSGHLDAELASSLPYLVQDLSNVPLEHIHLDYFSAPTPADGREKLHVAVADRRRLSALVQRADDVDLTLDLISIEELVLLDLLPPQPRPHILLWHLPGQPLKLLLAHEGRLLFSRNVRGFNLLDKLSDEEIRQGLYEELLLALQRSGDYLVRQLKQSAAEGLTLVLPLAQQQLLAPMLERDLTLSVQCLVDVDHSPQQILAHAAAMARGSDEDAN
ncbi:hypothetical protein [Ferrimonas pelagia]|uniref:hypothetical protein n=1 Tax=Ferrimonas pelagia TaxID=1177826 RepID=UPI0031F0F193